MNEKQLQDKINGTIWAACDTLRSSIPGGNYKDYALVMLFVKYLSDTYKEEKEKANEMYNGNEQMIERYLSRSKFILKEECTFDYLYNKRNEENIGEIINKALETITTLNGVKLLNLFAGVDFNSEVVFGKKKEKNAILKTLLYDFNNDDIDLRPSKIGNLDVIGNAYEYLIARFAGDSGKKGGEFYTPAEVSTLLAKLVEPKENDRIYDPACGSGSLLLKASKEVKDKKVSVYGQESNSSTYNLCRMNMFLHGVLPENQHLRNGDTLDADWPTDEQTEFDVVTMNPPYSAKWSAAEGFKQDERFMDYGGKLAPKSKADYAFLLHGFYHLKQTGTMAIVLPHGVLFRGAAEGTIRETLLQNGSIYAVIGLPANMFYNTSIPTCIIVLKKHREGRDVLFIDASQQYEKEKKQNEMKERHIDHVLELYNNRKTVEKEAYLASYEDIVANDFNLNIPRYVDTTEEEPEIDLRELTQNIKETDQSIKEGNRALLGMLKELSFNNDDTKEAVEEFIRVLEEV